MDITERQFVLKRARQRIGIKSSLLEYAALKRGLEVNRISPTVIIVTSHNGTHLPFSHMNGHLSSQVGRVLCDNKGDAKKLLRSAGLRIAHSALFSQEECERAWEEIQAWDFPIVIKPTSLSRGRGVSTGIETEEQFRAAWDKAFQEYRRPDRAKILVERQMPGEDFRFYVVNGETVFVTHRKRANVLGDGQSTIEQLIARKNAARSRNPYLKNHLIPAGIERLERLQRSGRTMDYVPQESEEVTLRDSSNLSGGGDSIDYTQSVHPGFRKLAIDAVAAMPGMQYAGVDIIAPSVTIAPTSDNYVISELENSPAPITHFPVSGKRQDMAGELLNFYLNLESANARQAPTLGRRIVHLSRKAVSKINLRGANR